MAIMCVLADVRKVVKDNEVFYCTSDIGRLIGLSKARSSVANYPTSYKHIEYTASKHGGFQQLGYISLDGVKRLLTNSRRTSATELAQELGINVLQVKVVTEESHTIACIKDAFPGETTIEQYTVNRFKIDLYFPDYKIAVECDEGFHNCQSNKHQDISRQKIITDTLGCKFVRYEPQTVGFTLFKVVGEIYSIIRQRKNAKDVL